MEAPALEHLFQPLTINGLTLPNRIVVGAIVTQFAGEDNLPTERWNAYYRRKARGGWGIVFTENYGVTPEGNCFKRQAGLWSDEQIPAHCDFVRQVHEAGCLIGCQIYHGGRQARSTVTGVQPIGPSAIKEPFCQDTPRAMSYDEVRRMVEAFGDCARRAKECGFDMVEIHGGHGYLVNEFMSAIANEREDDYGGSLEARMQFPLEIVADVRAKVGPDYPISFRLNTCDYVEGGTTVEQAVEQAKMLEAAGVDVIHCTQGMYSSMYAIIPPASVAEGAFVENAAAIKRAVSIPVVATGRINDPRLAEEILATGKADLVTMARASLADPDMPLKAREGRFDEIVKCVACNEGCAKNRGEDATVTCSINPSIGNEWKGNQSRVLPQS